MTPGTSSQVCAVVVTHRRPELLRRSLEALAAQSMPVDRVVVVDNGSDPATEAVVRSSGLETTYVPSGHNLGGAGGFALGMLLALAGGAEWVWCADDDGRPGGPATLATLRESAERHGLAAVSPLVVDEADPSRLAFPLRRGLTWRRHVSGFTDTPLIRGYASLFNGALFRATALDVVGVPDSRLFIRGDETEIHRRLRRSGLRFGTCTQAVYLHPQGVSEFVPILGGRLSVQYPEDAAKRYYTYRNRGYLLGQPGMRWMAALELVRFSYFFLSRRDPAGLRSWYRLVRAGRRERFARFAPSPGTGGAPPSGRTPS